MHLIHFYIFPKWCFEAGRYHHNHLLRVCFTHAGSAEHGMKGKLRPAEIVDYQLEISTTVIQWKPLNVINFVPRETDNIRWISDILVIWNQTNSVNLIALTVGVIKILVIILSGFHCSIDSGSSSPRSLLVETNVWSLRSLNSLVVDNKN